MTVGIARPRKASEVSGKIAIAMVSTVFAISSGPPAAVMCCEMMRACPAPSAWARLT